MSNSTGIDSEVAIIAGTGFESAFGGDGKVQQVTTPYGTVALSRVPFGERELLFLSRHNANHSVPPHKINYRAHLWALKDTGVSHILATAAVGSLRRDRVPGDLLVLSDLIDFRGETTTFFDGSDGDVRHTDISEPFSGTVREALIRSTDELAAGRSDSVTTYREGAYLCVSGPRYETPAEVRLFGSWGADVVGMTVAPEAILARELGIRYGVVAIVTNLGAGLSPKLLNHAEVGSQMELRREYLVKLFRTTATILFRCTDG